MTKVKVEVDDLPVKPKFSKSPKGSDPNATAIKKDVKKEHDHDTPLKAPKKEADPDVKKVPPADSNKLKKVKKEEVLSSAEKENSGNVSVKKKKGVAEEPEKREKKVYSLPGQKHDPPDERDALRIFYESLYNQNPKSEMAEIWMMEHGLLDLDDARKAFERKKKNQGNQKIGTPVKQNNTTKSEHSNTTVKSEKKSSSCSGDVKSSKPKRQRDAESDGDDDFIVKPRRSKSIV